MQKQNTETARFMAALDEQSPNWWRDFATCDDLRQCIDRHMGRQILRARVAARLLVPVRAALCAGIVALPEATVFEVSRDA